MKLASLVFGDEPKKADSNKLSSPQPGQIVRTADGSTYRVASKLAGPDGIVLKLANLQGKPVPTPAAFRPVGTTMTRFASWMRYHLAYNRDFDLYINSYIERYNEQHPENPLPYPTGRDGKPFRWADWFQSVVSPKLFVHGKGEQAQDQKDELIHEMLLTVLGHRNVLDQFVAKQRKGSKLEGLAGKLTDFLISTFMYRVDEMRNKFKEKNPEEEISMFQPGDTEEGDGEVNILETEEHGVGESEFESAEANRDIARFSQGFKVWLKGNYGTSAAEAFGFMFDIFWRMLSQEGASEIKRGELEQEWMQQTGLSFGSFKDYFARLPEAIEEYITSQEIELGDQNIFVDLMNVIKKERTKRLRQERRKKERARPAMVSSLRIAGIEGDIAEAIGETASPSTVDKDIKQPTESIDKFAWIEEDEDEEESVQDRLEYLRGELRAERISMEELMELQGLVEYIDPGDVELLEAAGEEEFFGHEKEYNPTDEEKQMLQDMGIKASKKAGTANERHVTPQQAQAFIDSIRPGDRVTILRPAGMGRDGQEWSEGTGKAVMRSSHGGWVLNMGGRHGTPGIADVGNIVSVRPAKRASYSKQAETVETSHGSMTYEPKDVVNPDDYIAQGEFNPHKVRPWLIHNEFGTLAIVYASNEQDALDEAVDGDKMDSCLIPEADVLEAEKRGEDDFARLGNAGEPFDLTYIGLIPLPNQQYGVSEVETDTMMEGMEGQIQEGADQNLMKSMGIQSSQKIAKLLRGDQLTPDMVQQVKDAFIYRWTKDNPRRGEVYHCDKCDVKSNPYVNTQSAEGHQHPTIPLQSDDEWIAEHAFYFTNKGVLQPRRHAQPSYLAQQNPEHVANVDMKFAIEKASTPATPGGQLACCGGFHNRHKPDCSVYNDNFNKTIDQLHSLGKRGMLGHDFSNAEHQAINPETEPETGRMPHVYDDAELKPRNAAGSNSGKDDARGAGDNWREEYYESNEGGPSAKALFGGDKTAQGSGGTTVTMQEQNATIPNTPGKGQPIAVPDSIDQTAGPHSPNAPATAPRSPGIQPRIVDVPSGAGTEMEQTVQASCKKCGSAHVEIDAKTAGYDVWCDDCDAVTSSHTAAGAAAAPVVSPNVQQNMNLVRPQVPPPGTPGATMAIMPGEDEDQGGIKRHTVEPDLPNAKYHMQGAQQELIAAEEQRLMTAAFGDLKQCAQCDKIDPEVEDHDGTPLCLTCASGDEE